jgi:transcriptional regulator with XRE-family HTH domain
MTEPIGPRLAELRKIHLRLTQKALAARLGSEWYRIKDLETGKVKKLSLELARALEKEFGVSIDWLLTGSGPVFRETLPAGKEGGAPGLPFMAELEKLPPWSEARAAVIYAKAIDALGMDADVMWLDDAAIRRANMEGRRRYLEREIGDGELFAVAREELRERFAKTLERLKRLEKLGMLPTADPDEPG